MLIARCIQPTLVKCDSYETLVCNTSNTSNTAINGNDSSYRNPSAITVAVALRYLTTAESVSRNARQITPAMQMSTSSTNAATVIFVPVEASAPVPLEDA